jgi:E3 ubiquitin-protein ligase SHPRH
MDVIADKHGSKIMFLVKHLRWLEREDPGTKAVVFSSWAASLSSKL